MVFIAVLITVCTQYITYVPVTSIVIYTNNYGGFELIITIIMHSSKGLVIYTVHTVVTLHKVSTTITRSFKWIVTGSYVVNDS